MVDANPSKLLILKYQTYNKLRRHHNIIMQSFKKNITVIKWLEFRWWALESAINTILNTVPAVVDNSEKACGSFSQFFRGLDHCH